jgi:hypothetical protein
VTISWPAIEAEASEIVASATERGMTVRVVGSTGIRMHCAAARAAMDDVERPAKDLDLVVRSGDRNGLRSLLEARGYAVDRDLLVAMEGQRFAFHHPAIELELHLFVERLQFCHTIELGDRWARHATTIPIEDLLLQKLQVHELTGSDVIDAAVVLATHDVGPGGDPERIDRDYVAGVLAGDWGFHRDAVANLDRVREAQVPLSAEQLRRVDEAAGALRDAIGHVRKSMAWRMRARVGERMQWWEDVSERVDTY